MKADQAAKFDQELRRAGQTGAIDDQTIQKVLEAIKDYNESIKRSVKNEGSTKRQNQAAGRRSQAEVN